MRDTTKSVIEEGKKLNTAIKNVRVFTTVFFLIITSPLFSQIGFLKTETASAEIEAHIDWTSPPSGRDGVIVVSYILPEPWQQSDLPELFGFAISNEESNIIPDEIIRPDPQIIREGSGYYADKVELKRSFKILKISDQLTLSIEAQFQLCLPDGTCLLPETKSIVLTETIPDEVKKGIGKSLVSARTMKNSIILNLLFLLFAFIGGVLLNLMPCIFPLLSIKALTLVRQREEGKVSIIRSGWFYLLGIETSFAIIAVVMIAIQRGGGILTWGFQMQNPIFVFAITALLFLFALSLLGVFTVPGLKAGATGSGAKTAFLSGLFAVAAAAPCSAPLLGGALGFFLASAPSAGEIFAVLLTTGAGLAAPYLLLAFFPGLIRRLPRSGAWTLLFEKIMGFLLMGVSLYIFSLLLLLAPTSAVTLFLVTLLLWSFSLWCFGQRQKQENFITNKGKLTIVAAILFSLFPLYRGIGNLKEEPDNALIQKNIPEGAEEYSRQLLDRLRGENEPVFVEFSAEWCTTCKVNKTTTLNTEGIREHFSEKRVKWLYADLTKPNKTLTEELNSFGRAGLPLYIYFAPGAEEGIILPELLTTGIVKGIVR